MQVFDSYTDIPPEMQGAAIAIGNFDGVHLGHRAVIGEAGLIARSQGVPWAVMTFEPHPRLFFRPAQPPFCLTPLRAKTHAIAALGVDMMVVLPFDKHLATMKAEAFVEDVLVGGLKVHHVVCGYNFNFGKGQGGNAHLLFEMGQRLGFDFTAVNPVEDPSGLVYSSTRIRELLQRGEPKAAAAILGRPFEIDGAVAEGDRRGRTIGFPTANIAAADYIEPRFGVYAVRLALDAKDSLVNSVVPDWIDGVANLGMRPTFDKTEPVLEVHLFYFEGDLYGKDVRVQILDFIRPEHKFDGLDALRAQIAADCQTARVVLKSL